MVAKFSERDVHRFVHVRGLEALVKDCPQLDVDLSEEQATEVLDGDEEDFALWRIIKARALGKLERIHNSVRYGTFVGSNVKLPTDHTTPMELDLLGLHEDGHFVLELKVDRAAERNAFCYIHERVYYRANWFTLRPRVAFNRRLRPLPDVARSNSRLQAPTVRFNGLHSLPRISFAERSGDEEVQLGIDGCRECHRIFARAREQPSDSHNSPKDSAIAANDFWESQSREGAELSRR